MVGEAGKRSKIIGVAVVVVGGLFVLALAWGALFGSDGDDSGVPPSAACLQVPDETETGISDGFNSMEATSWAAVRSGDYNRAWFVAARTDKGEGLWVTNEIAGSGSVYAVNDVAVANSDWGDGGRTKAGFSMDDDGAADALACL